MRTLNQQEIRAVSGAEGVPPAQVAMGFVYATQFFFASIIYTLTGKVPSWFRLPFPS